MIEELERWLDYKIILIAGIISLSSLAIMISVTYGLG